MSEVNEVAQQVYGDSWGSFLEKATGTAEEQPLTDSEPVTEEVEQEEPNSVEESEPDDEVTEADEHEETEVVDDPDIDLGDGTKPVKLSELKNGFMRQADYTKKTQALANERKEFEQQREGLQDVQAWKEHMENNPWLWEQVNRALTEFNDTGVLPIDEVLQDAQYGKYVNHLLAENNQLKKKLDSINGEYEGVKLTNAMQSLQNDLKADYGDLVTDEYMSKLQERAKAEKLSTDTLKEIAEGFLAKQKLSGDKTNLKKATKQAEAKAIQKLAETKKVAAESPRNVAARPSAETKSIDGGWGDWMRQFKN